MLTSPISSSGPAASAGASEDCWGLLASSLLHVAAIAALGCTFLPPASDRVSPAVVTTWSTPPADTPVEPPVVELRLPQSSTSGGRFVSIAAVPLPTPNEPIVAIDERVALPTGPMVADIDVRETVRLSASAASNGTGQGQGDGAGDGSGQGRPFFPVEQPTGRFVFVVDASKSMNQRYSGPAKTRLGRVKVELWRTIYGMSPSQKFFIMFFDTRARPMPSTTLRSGGMEQQTDLFNWTAALRAEGKTDPQEALLLAMQMQPDAIYFLTDGEFNYRVVQAVTKANFGGTRIHTISLGDDSGADFLKEIAEKNGGSYRHIVEEEDHYWNEETAAARTSATGEAATVLPDGK